MRILLSCAVLALSGCQSQAAVSPAPAPPTAPHAPAASAPAQATSATASAAPAPAPAPPTAVSASLDAHAPDDRWSPDATCAEKRCDLVLDRRHVERAPDAPVAVLHVTAGAGEWRLPYDERLDVSLVVTKGAAKVTDPRSPKHPIELATWSALAIGAGGVSITGDARIVVVVASADGKSLRDTLATDTKAKTWSAPAPRALAPVAVGGLEDLAWGGGAYHARIVWGATERAKAAVSVIVFSRDAAVKEHDHDHEWECLSVRSGEGTLTLAGKAIAVAPGEVVCVPPGKRHAWTPSGDKPLVAVQVYSPGGPEQRFKKLAGK